MKNTPLTDAPAPAPAERPSWSTGRPTEDAWSPRAMTAAPDTETRVIVDMMLALRNLIERCDKAQEAGSQCLSPFIVRTIAASALINATESAQPAHAVRKAAEEQASIDKWIDLNASEIRRLVDMEIARRSAVRSTP